MKYYYYNEQRKDEYERELERYLFLNRKVAYLYENIGN